MIKKIFKCLIVFILLSLLSSCTTGSALHNFPVEKDTSRDSLKYGKTEIYCGLLNEYGFNEFKRYGRRMLVENTSMSENEKLEVANSIDQLQYEDSKFLYFTITYNMPFIFSELKLKFKLLDMNGGDLYSGSILVPIERHIYSGGATNVVYNYTFIIKSREALNKIKTDKLVVTFPDKSEIIYKLKI